MEAIKIYNRATNSWTKPTPIISGFQENWVLDRTTDFAKDIKFKFTAADAAIIGIESEATKPCPNPPFGICDWVLLFHLDDAEVMPTDCKAYINDDGSPINHTQYIIGDIVSEYNGIDGYWWVMLSLVEPIERFRGVLGETLSYTNNCEPYYNHLTALERWLKVTPANRDNYAAGEDRKRNVSWYNRIKISDEDKKFLKSLPFADNTLNELSLYELLLDIYDSATGRTPVAYFDLAQGGGHVLNPNRDEYILNFEKQDGSDKRTIPIAELTNKCSGMTYTKTGANYATGLISNVDNLAPAETVVFPAENLYAVPEVDNNDRVLSVAPYTTAPSDNWVVKLPFPIKNIKKVLEVKAVVSQFVSVEAWREECSMDRTKSDVTSDVYEVNKYNALDIDNHKNNKLFWYKEGENLLHVRKYESVESPVGYTIYDKPGVPAYMYQVAYEPLINARVQSGTNDFCLQLNQNSSQVDSFKFGKYMDSYLDGMNKADLVIKKTYVGLHGFNTFKDYIGSKVFDEATGKEYLITAVSYRNRNLLYDALFQLNENHMRKSNNYQASQEIRTNIGIPIENVKDRRIVITHNIKLELEHERNAESLQKFEELPRMHVYNLQVLSALLLNTAPYFSPPQIAVFRTADKTVFMPICKCMLGKQLNIFAQFEDNAMAGKRKEVPKARPDKYLYKEIGPTVRQMPVLYTNNTGRADVASLELVTVNAHDLGNLVKGNLAEIATTAAVLKTMSNFPQTETDAVYKISVSVFNQILLKDASERINENLVIEVVSDSMIVCKSLLQKSSLMTDVVSALGVKFSTKNILEDETLNTEHSAVAQPSIEGGSNKIKITFPTVSNNTGKPWKAVAFTANNNGIQQLLIINDLDTKNRDIMETIKEGYINIYYS